LDYRKGKPLKNVSLEIGPMPWRMVHGKVVNTTTVKSDSTGVAKFCLTDPISGKLGVSLDGRYFESCSGYIFETAPIMKSGYLARDNQCHGRTTFKFTESSKPGELVILVRHIGWLERNTEWP
jgi:hypothetical protein